MRQFLNEAVDQIRRKLPWRVIREKARATARKLALTLLDHGSGEESTAYRLIPSDRADLRNVIGVYKAGSEEPDHGIAVGVDRRTGKFQLVCSCAFWAAEDRSSPGNGWCKHTLAAEQRIRETEPLIRLLDRVRRESADAGVTTFPQRSEKPSTGSRQSGDIRLLQGTFRCLTAPQSEWPHLGNGGQDQS